MYFIHVCFGPFFFFFLFGWERTKTVFQYMTRGGAEKTRAQSIGQVLLGVFAENRIVCQLVLTYCTHTDACLAFVAGKMKEER